MRSRWDERDKDTQMKIMISGMTRDKWEGDERVDLYRYGFGMNLKLKLTLLLISR